MNKKILMGLLSVVTIPLLAACQGGETPSAASKNSQTVTTQSSAKLKAPVQPVRWLKQHQKRK